MALIVGDNTDNDIVGTDGSDRIIAKGGDDTLYGGEGNDDLRGGAGSDQLFGGAGNDILWGDETKRGSTVSDPDFFNFDMDDGNDIIRDFGDNVDTICLTEGGTYTMEQVGEDVVITYGATTITVQNMTTAAIADDIKVTGGLGPVDANMKLVGTPGPDVLIGGSGDDKIVGKGGDDILNGAGGNDHLIGGEGDDVLIGGDGDDVLRGDASSRALNNDGADTFVFDENDGNDILVDFDDNMDVLQFSGGSAGATATLVDSGDDVIVTYEATMVTVRNMSAADIADDIAYV